MKRWGAALAGLLLLSGAAAARAAGSQQDVLDRLARGAAGIETLRGGIVQEKHLEMFQETVVSRGRFAYRRPDRLRWELTDPVVTGFVINGAAGRRWHGVTGKKEDFTLEREPLLRVVAGQLLSWARADFGGMQREYKISVASESPITLVLEPLSPNVMIERVTVVFTAAADHVASVTVGERGGDRTVIRFTDVEVNRPLPDDLF